VIAGCVTERAFFPEPQPATATVRATTPRSMPKLLIVSFIRRKAPLRSRPLSGVIPEHWPRRASRAWTPSEAGGNIRQPRQGRVSHLRLRQLLSLHFALGRSLLVAGPPHQRRRGLLRRLPTDHSRRRPCKPTGCVRMAPTLSGSGRRSATDSREYVSSLTRATASPSAPRPKTLGPRTPSRPPTEARPGELPGRFSTFQPRRERWT